MAAPRGKGFGRKDFDREMARARSARRMLPWSAATAAGGAALALAAGGGPRAAGALFVLGLVFAAFVWTTSIARCPACGTPLRRGRAADPRGASAATPEPVPSCPSCLARFE